MSTQSSYLALFYKELQAWIDGGCVGPYFSVYEGICPNLTRWAWRNGLSHYPLKAQLEDQFLESDFPSTLYPFNRQSGQAPYGTESMAGTIYKNPLRLAWIKSHAA